jgi:hypothetical protein
MRQYPTDSPFAQFNGFPSDALNASIQFCNQRILINGEDPTIFVDKAYEFLKSAIKFQNALFKLMDYPLRGDAVREKRKPITKKQFVYLLDQQIIDMLYYEGEKLEL